MFFDTWSGLLRTVLVGVPAYVGLVLFLRVSGKRTLSKMNAFDFVVTVALGSTLATILLSEDVALAEGLAALALLIFLQLVITWSSVRSDRFQRIIKARPRLLAFEGELDRGAMREERVSREEVAAAVRDRGIPGVGATWAVVMETDGTLAVIPRQEEVDARQALEHVGLPEDVARRLREG